MLNDLVNLGLNTIGAVSVTALQAQRRQDRAARHPLAGYPKLFDALSAAERAGSLRSERRSLEMRSWQG